MQNWNIIAFMQSNEDAEGSNKFKKYVRYKKCHQDMFFWIIFLTKSFRINIFFFSRGIE